MTEFSAHAAAFMQSSDNENCVIKPRRVVSDALKPSRPGTTPMRLLSILTLAAPLGPGMAAALTVAPTPAQASCGSCS